MITASQMSPTQVVKELDSGESRLRLTIENERSSLGRTS